MLSISFGHVSGGISVHSFATLSHNSCTPLGGVSYCWSLALRCCQRCSMGFNSGDWAGHFMGMLLLSKNHCSTCFEVCFGSLACWKYYLSSAISKLSMLSSTPPSNISQYCTASIFPCTSISIPTLSQLIHPQIIKLFPPPYLTVGVVVLSVTSSPCCFQTYTFPSDQSYWFLSHQSTTPSSSPPQSNFHSIGQILDVTDDETPWS